MTEPAILANEPELPAARSPSVGRAVRDAGADLYLNSSLFVPANLVWGVVALVIGAVVLAWTPGLVFAVFLAAPLAGIFRMAALLARGDAASLGDFLVATRQFALPSIGVAAAGLGVALILVIDIDLGFGGSLGLFGWFLGASGIYGLLALVMLLVAVWPVLVDPAHDDLSIRRRLQLAGLVMIGRPGRLFAVTVLVVGVLAIATVLLGVLLIVGVAFAALLATRWVLPTLDYLEARVAADRSAR